MADWNAGQYLKFKAQRTRPAADLLEKINKKSVENILDIGCGPGNSTILLAEKYPRAKVTGIDASPAMIEEAEKNYPDINFRLCDAAAELTSFEEKYDIIFSNACIQWVPDHEKLIKNIFDLLQPGGIFAVQVPMNFEEPIHRTISEAANSEKWKSRFSFRRVFYTLKENDYFGILSRYTSVFDMWRTVYFHRMPSLESIIEWYRSTGLRPYLDQLGEEEKKDFEAEITEKLKTEYPVQENGEIIFRFPRLFFTAEKNDGSH